MITTHYLYPGAIFTHQKPYEVSTILGSCVSVCLWDSYLEIGGINHFMLPFWNGDGLASPKYGNIATEKLLDKMLALGSSTKNLSAKVFGGAKQLETGSFFNVGERNVSLALEFLKEQHISIISQNTGGERGRKLIFRTHSGEVFMKFV
ncbi:chemotaxis protein CheD [Rhodocytophaga rosea]|uniref:Probable chemoreceptor glutamine deamidase CheD n=1 Tax=Rhodocytophaga rosea TaxID=2704465 RepID=A0A6C0GJA6_9BACT|nr:chemotaxis protein CheD [Rhodocytophaga rosea]QHT68151.1 chemotaxis protein CheD [Rhodocytophaga rosea]